MIFEIETKFGLLLLSYISILDYTDQVRSALEHGTTNINFKTSFMSTVGIKK